MIKCIQGILYLAVGISLTSLQVIAGSHASAANVEAERLPGPKPMSKSQLKKAMLENLDAMKSIYDGMYAPGRYKAATQGWNIEEQAAIARMQIQSMCNPTVAAYRDVIRRFVLSMKDYHVGVRFHSTERSSLPLALLSAENRYFLAWIDRDKLPESSFPYQVGDEVVSFDGKPVAEAVKDFEIQLGANTPETDHTFAVALLTSRSNANYGNVCKGDIEIGIQPRSTSKVQKAVLNWNYTPELIKEISNPIENPARNMTGNAFLQAGNLKSPLPDPMASLGQGNPLQIGHKDGCLPAFGEKTWEAPQEAIFRAYIYKHPVTGRPIGYVRIRSYDMPDFEGAVREFKELIQRFQNETDGLVVDQLNNPGGSVLYFYQLASMLIDKPVETTRHRFALNQERIAQALDFITADVTTDEQAQAFFGGRTLAGHPVNMELFNGFLEQSRFFVSEWEKGKTMTDLMHLDGVGTIKPSAEAHYTKPMMVLINEQDYSCGDFFPALMQDAKRAVLFGTRTAGAGGRVWTHKFPNILGVADFSMTDSLAERMDKSHVENLGVRPDVPCPFTANDLQNGFQDYIRSANATLSELLKTRK